MININTLNGGTITITSETPGPAGHPETRITFSDGSSDTYEWSGEIDQQTMVDAGLYDDNEWTWIKQPVTVDIGNSVTNIGQEAFNICDTLTSVTIPNSVTNIGSSAFYNCSGLMNVTISNSVKSIGYLAFGFCSGLTNVTIPDSVMSIGERAFRVCDGLTSVTIGNGVTNIGPSAFSDCTSLTSVTFLGKTLEQVQAMDNYPWGIEDTSIISVA